MKEYLDRGTVVDVRNEDEFLYDHFPNAMNIPIFQLPLRIDEFRKMKKPIITYCKGGNRSAMVASILETMGISHVINGGGLEALRKHLPHLSEN